MNIINEDLARRSKENMSFSDYKAGSATAEFNAEIERVDEIIKEFLSNAGKKGGSVKSEAKAKAARENGKKGGRPRKNKKGEKEMRAISIKELTCETYSVKDNSVRGIKTASKNDVKIGDKIVIDNYFTLVTE